MLLMVTLTKGHKRNSYAQSNTVKETVSHCNLTTRDPDTIDATDIFSLVKTAVHIVYKNVHVPKTATKCTNHNIISTKIWLVNTTQIPLKTARTFQNAYEVT